MILGALIFLYYNKYITINETFNRKVRIILRLYIIPYLYIQNLPKGQSISTSTHPQNNQFINHGTHTDTTVNKTVWGGVWCWWWWLW